jgi:hypothetical protein
LRAAQATTFSRTIDIDVHPALAVEINDLDAERTRKFLTGRGSRYPAHPDAALGERADEGGGGVAGAQPYDLAGFDVAQRVRAQLVEQVG